jgi:carboxyl-terminal processing protease
MNQSAKYYSPLQAALIGGAIATTATIAVFSQAWTKSVYAALQDSPKALVDQVWQLVNREYVDDKFNQQDWQAIRQDLLSKDYTSKEEAYVAIRAALQKLGDPYTRFMNPQQYESLTSQTSGEVSGIGIRMQINENTKRLTVIEAIDNSPALKAGLKSGDEILAIDGKSTLKMTVEDGSKLIRGQVGTSVSLDIERLGSKLKIKLTRATIEVPTVRYTLKQEANRRVGYIRLQEFSSHAADQMRAAIRRGNSEKVDSYVLDLRGNPGGLLNASIEIARMWLNDGHIVKTVDRKGWSAQTTANGTAITKLPLAILVDGNSASASEILTGALKDNKRAVGLAVTIAHYYTPNGTDINHKGIAPDIKLDLTQTQERQLASNPSLIGTNSDPQYARAIAALSNGKLAQTVKSQNSQSVSVSSEDLKF